MYIYFENGSILTNIINSIKDLVDQGTFTCTSDCLEFKSLDKSIQIEKIQLVSKTGGKSGDYLRKK